MPVSLPDLIKTENKNHLIFDFDATIARLVIDWKLWHVGVANIIRKFEPNFIYEGGRMDLRLNGYIKKYGNELRDTVRGFNAFYENQNITHVLYNVPLISLIKKLGSYKSYIYSSNSRYTIKPILKKLKIDECFVKYICLEDVIYRKPDPDGLQQIIAPNVALSEYLMIGDSEATDGDAARAVGVDFFLITMKK
ncbi:MAG: HAD-IA family hydrolase [Patescibacteria group bacterium]